MGEPSLTIGTGRSQCGGCGRYFSGVSAFEKHQTLDKLGEVVCHDPATRGLVLVNSWWSWPDSGRERPIRVGAISERNDVRGNNQQAVATQRSLL